MKCLVNKSEAYPNDMTGWLVNAAEASNLLSLLTVVCTFTLMVFFLLRLIGQDMAEGTALTTLKHTPPRVQYTRVLLPFCLAWRGVVHTNRVEMRLSAVQEGRSRFFWGVDIAAFHQVLRAPRLWFLRAFVEGNLFGDGKCRELGKIQEFHSCQDNDISVSRSSTLQLNLGPAPRDEFPLVVVLMGAEGESLITAVHIRDTACPVPSQILAQYYRYGDVVSLLQPLYLATLDLGESSDTESQEDSETEELQGARPKKAAARCIICQQERISRVILPCRHAVTCGACFTRLESRCPMCRGFVQSYFLMRAEPSPPPPPPPSSPHQDSGPNVAAPPLVRSVLQNVRLWLVGPRHRPV